VTTPADHSSRGDRDPESRSTRPARFETRGFIFGEWAETEGFGYPQRAAPILDRTGSPAEAYFVRALFELPGVLAEDETAYYKGARINVQVPFGRFVIDAVAQRSFCRLAIEIDGFAQHHATPRIVDADYFRARRLLYAGYVVIRFTATEAINNGRMCWRSVLEVLDVQLRLRAG